MSSSNQSFSPFSSQLGIAGTSYRLQMGRVNDKWASRILKGSDVIESTIYNDNDIPNANLVVGWCLKVIAIPNINPYQVMKTVQFLRKETERNWEESKTRVVASATDAREAKGKLEKVPEAELKRHAEAGWVKDEAAEGKAGAPATAPSAPTSVAAQTSSAQMGAPRHEAPKAGAKAPTSAPGAVISAGDIQVKSYSADDKNRLRQKLATIPGASAAPVAATSPAAPSAGVAAASASGGAAGAIKCKNCGTEIKFCPVCGKSL